MSCLYPGSPKKSIHMDKWCHLGGVGIVGGMRRAGGPNAQFVFFIRVVEHEI